MGASAKAVSGVAVEAASYTGITSLLPPTAVSALPVSLTTSIPAAATTGMRLLIRVFGHTATGTITVAGKAPGSGATVSETTTTFATAEVPGECVDYVTSKVYGSVDSSGVTVTGLTNGQVVIYGIQAAKTMILGETKISDKVQNVSPELMRGTFDRDYHILTTTVDTEAEYSGPLYPTNGLWMLQGQVNGAPSATTIPASPPSLLASTSVATSGTASLTTQPSAPGMILGIALGGTAPATAATVSVTGTNIYGETVTEVIVPSTKAQGTYYSSNIFASVSASGVSFGAFGTGATITVTGYFGWSLAASPADTISSMVLEQFDSTGNYVAPWWALSEFSLEGGADKEAKVMTKGKTQAVFTVGDVTSGTQQITAFAQPLDEPITAYDSLVYIDAIGGTPGTTQVLSCIDWKVTVKREQAFKKTSWGNPPTRMGNRVYSKKREVEIDLTCDLDQTTYQNEYMAFKNKRTRYVQLQVRGRLIGVDSGTSYYEGFTVTVPVKWIEDPSRDLSPSKENVEVKLKGKGFVDPGLGYSHTFTWIARRPSF